MEERDILLMAALIAAVRTARFEGKDFEGMSTPKTIAALQNSLWIARKLCELHTTNVANQAQRDRDNAEYFSKQLASQPS